MILTQTPKRKPARSQPTKENWIRTGSPCPGVVERTPSPLLRQSPTTPYPLPDPQPTSPTLSPHPLFILEQTIQTTTTSQRSHNTRADPPAGGSPAPIVLVAAGRRVALLRRVHGLLLVLHGLLLVGPLLAAVVVLALAWRGPVGAWAAHGRGGGAVALLWWVVGAGVLGWVAWGWHVGGFVGHFLFLWSGWCCGVVCATEAFGGGVGSGSLCGT